MTISIIKSIFIFATLLLTSQFIIAQSGLNQTFEFDGSDSEKEYVVNVGSNASDLTIKFTGNITDGMLTVKVIDPAGNSQNGFHLVCSEESTVTVTEKGSGHQTSTIVRSGSGSNDEDVIEIKSGESTTISRKSDSGNTVNVEAISNSDKDKEKSKDKNKSKSKNKNLNKSRTSYTYTVEDDNDRGAKGVIEEIMGDPAPGQWKFIVMSDGAKGSLEMIVKQK